HLLRRRADEVAPASGDEFVAELSDHARTFLGGLLILGLCPRQAHLEALFLAVTHASVDTTFEYLHSSASRHRRLPSVMISIIRSTSSSATAFGCTACSSRYVSRSDCRTRRRLPSRTPGSTPRRMRSRCRLRPSGDAY